MIDQIKPYIDIFSMIVNLTILGVIIKIFSMIRIAYKEKEETLRTRIEKIEDDLNRTEKWANREKEKLQEEKNQYKNKLNELLKNAKIDDNPIEFLNSLNNIELSIKNEISLLMDKIDNLENKNNSEEIDVDYHLSLADGYVVKNEWEKAAYHYDIAITKINDNWNLHFKRGISHANTKKDRDSFYKALQSYSNAIIFIPDEIDNNVKARLYIYKGAMLKRLQRYQEAIVNIKYGQEIAEDAYEILDSYYNLGGIYAIQNKIEELVKVVNYLKINSEAYLNVLINYILEWAPKVLQDKRIIKILQ